ncbi:dCTP deaminase [Burkholderia metallica]|uniref:dCTP deaminase n=1 Tax=Burkholderia metallica TaxID=488729 RepID=UPI00157ADC58|nr:dCTP deaminase [Burkholderia metallica]NTZ82542.1 dCTP deaminase [Burkholderia metallica]
MSALSKREIVERLRSESLVISPILSQDQIGLSSVDLRMGTVVLIAKAGAQSHVDPADYLRKPDDHDSIRDGKQKHERFDVPFRESFLLHPGTLALVPTLEWVKIPLNLQGVVTARSSWAREGLNIATATIVNPGYVGIVTLELANFGEIPIRLYPGLRLAQIAFYSLDANVETKKTGWLNKRHRRTAMNGKNAGRGVVASRVVTPNTGQFQMSFEPSAGNIAKGDSAFITPIQKD